MFSDCQGEPGAGALCGARRIFQGPDVQQLRYVPLPHVFFRHLTQPWLAR
jgi:hypothetical protein